jgi:hypothetical protein
MPKIVVLSDEEKENIRKDRRAGKPETEIADKYGISRTKVRDVLGLIISKKKLTQEEKIVLRKKIIKKQDKRIKEKVEALEVTRFGEIIRGDYVDVFEGIRQSMNDMIELNKEQKEALTEMLATLEDVKKKFDKIADPENDTDTDLRNALWKMITQVGSYYGRGKLRIDSRKELGNWIDRYKDFNMISLQFTYYEKIINAFFEAINLLSNFEYEKVRNTAIGVFDPIKRYFDQNEQQAAAVHDEHNNEQKQ